MGASQSHSSDRSIPQRELALIGPPPPVEATDGCCGESDDDVTVWVVYSGPLHRRTRRTGAWRARFFRLEGRRRMQGAGSAPAVIGGQLCYFATEAKSGGMPAQKACLAIDHTTKLRRITKVKNGKQWIRISTDTQRGEQAWTVRAATVPLADTWLGLLKGLTEGTFSAVGGGAAGETTQSRGRNNSSRRHASAELEALHGKFRQFRAMQDTRHEGEVQVEAPGGQMEKRFLRLREGTLRLYKNAGLADAMPGPLQPPRPPTSPGTPRNSASARSSASPRTPAAAARGSWVDGELPHCDCAYSCQRAQTAGAHSAGAHQPLSTASALGLGTFTHLRQMQFKEGAAAGPSGKVKRRLSAQMGKDERECVQVLSSENVWKTLRVTSGPDECQKWKDAILRVCEGLKLLRQEVASASETEQARRRSAGLASGGARGGAAGAVALPGMARTNAGLHVGAVLRCSELDPAAAQVHAKAMRMVKLYAPKVGYDGFGECEHASPSVGDSSLPSEHAHSLCTRRCQGRVVLEAALRAQWAAERAAGDAGRDRLAAERRQLALRQQSDDRRRALTRQELAELAAEKQKLEVDLAAQGRKHEADLAAQSTKLAAEVEEQKAEVKTFMMARQQSDERRKATVAEQKQEIADEREKRRRLEAEKVRMEQQLKFFETPKYWKPGLGDAAQVVELDRTNAHMRAAWDDVAARCLRTTSVQILDISVVQDPHKWQAYSLKKHQLAEKLKASGGANEQRVFHAGPEAAVRNIATQGFRREYNTVSQYGFGNYFARDLQYSVSDRYSKPNEKGEKFVFLARILAGEACQGKKGMNMPSQKPNGELFECMVNDPNSPGIYVLSAGSDEHAYPEFLVKFKV
jgi:poly [ADP-ribose] polymerase 10/14/15